MHLNLTREEAIRKHRNMWRWIAKRVLKDKDVHMITSYKHEYMQKYFKNQCVHNCFLCEYANENCTKCPIDWKSKMQDVEGARCYCLDNKEEGDFEGVYGRAYTTVNKDEQSRLALIISELPEKEEENV